MVDSITAADFIPAGADLEGLRAAAAGCRGCSLWSAATQTVFGEGAGRARVLLVGEQPGDQEDLSGRPFVGPAGKLLDTALREAGIDRGKGYVANVVKHFKWEPRGPRRIHKTPTAAEVVACRPWLEAEIGALRPRVIVALGATAGRSLLGPSYRVTQHRGQFFPGPGEARITGTIHPSAILRAPDEAARVVELAAFTADLARVAPHVGGG
ncbi:MAG: UdgX family uracil-DNA binding protein [Candidatus Dormibacteria bacterium]